MRPPHPFRHTPHAFRGPLGSSTDDRSCSHRVHARFGTSHVSWANIGDAAPTRMQLVLQLLVSLLVPLLVPLPMQRAQPILA